jgi:hypothetical protein
MLSQAAERELAAWEGFAARTATKEIPVIILRCEQLMMTGYPCGRSIAVLTDNYEVPIEYTDGQVLAFKVLHLRNFHPDLDPNKPGQPV